MRTHALHIFTSTLKKPSKSITTMASDLAYYSLDSQISTFFRTHDSVTREQCDNYVRLSLANLSRPNQSRANQCIIQFRAHSSVLNMELVALARDTYGTIEANCIYHGTVAQRMPLPVYVMEKLPGVAYTQVQPSPDPGRPMSPAAASRVINTVTEFARLLQFSRSLT